MSLYQLAYKVAYALKGLQGRGKYIGELYFSRLHGEKKIVPRQDYNEAVKYLENFRVRIRNNYDNIQRKKTENVDLSIIIPIYNAEKYLSECLHSVLNQKTRYSYELICVNDGSNDGSLEIINYFQEKYKNITVVNQNNKGSSDARNSGLRIMNGKYVLFIDADDFLVSDSINSLMDTAVSTNADIVQGQICKCNTYCDVFYKYKVKQTLTSNYIQYCQSLGTAWGKLYKTVLWKDIEFYQSYAYEDTIVFLVIYLKCVKMAFIDKDIYSFRSSSNSLFKRQNNSFKMLDALWIVNECIDFCKSRGIEFTQQYYQVLLWHLSVGLITRIHDTGKTEILESAFVVARKMVMEFDDYRGSSFSGKNRKLYKKLETSFYEKNFFQWKINSRLLELSGGI